MRGKWSVQVNLDFANAFNCLLGDRILTSTNAILPKLACHLAYSDASISKYGIFSFQLSLAPNKENLSA